MDSPTTPWRKRHPRLARWRDAARSRRARWFAALVFLAHLSGAVTSVRAIMEVRTAQGAIAWAVSLNTFPYVAVPAYWIFGRTKFQGMVTLRRTEAYKTDATARAFLTALTNQNLALTADQARDTSLPLTVERLARLPITRGNDAELLVDGEATFQSLFAGIARAKRYILVEFYIVRDDEVGRELKQALIERARAGVRCFVIYDEVGSGGLPKSYLEELRAAGVRIHPFLTTQGPANRFQINFRNHRKIVIVDGLEAWVGGLNVGREYKGLDPKMGYWRDTHLRVTGPVVQCTQVAFLEDWQWATQELLQDLNWNPQPASSGASRAILALPSGPADPLETCTLFFVHAINTAKTRLWIASPYFVPDEQFITALQLAALRGVDVRILIPDRTDNPLVEFSGWSYLADLESTGIKTFRYTKGFLHHKVVVVDDDYCSVGTANFDNRSFRLNFEITLAIANRDFTQQVIRMLENDFASARPVTVAELAARRFWFRFAVRASRLTAPIQ